jgi:Mitochondrial carrier protein
MSLGTDMRLSAAGEHRYVSTWHCMKDTFREAGFVGMHRGMGITMIRAFIGTYALGHETLIEVNAVTFYGYEWTKKWLDKR